MSLFRVEHVALHWVDRKLGAPVYAEGEVKLDAFDNPDDRQALESFFQTHLQAIWKSEEGNRLHAAMFLPDSPVAGCYAELYQDHRRFFLASKEIAQRLYEKSPARASPGLLLALWFYQDGDERPFLGLLKMQPARSDRITLRHAPGKDTLLGLAITHLDQALPEVGERVLKWAVVPHPTRTAFQVKVKDEQSKADLARYFLDFLGCAPRKSEKDQARSLLEALPEYASLAYAGKDWSPTVREVVMELEHRPQINPEVVVEVFRTVAGAEGFREDLLRAMLADRGGQDIRFPASILRSARAELRLDSGITIRGPWAAMDSLVEIRDTADGGQEVRIRAKRIDRKISY